MKSISWNMVDVRAAERFAYWREAVCQTYLPLEPEDLSGGAFDGSINGTAGDSLSISRVKSVAAVIQRTRRGISAFQDGTFYANLQLRGEAMVEQSGQRAIARPGDIVLVDTNEPFSIRFEQGCDLLCAAIPGSRLRQRLQRVTRQPINVISHTGVGRLASAYLNALRDIPEDFQLVDDLAGDQLSTLLVRAAAAQAGEAAAPSRRDARRQQILDFIRDELDNPLLSAKYVCRHLRLSRSALFEILGEADIAFASYIRSKRLEYSARSLSDLRLAGVAVGDIGLRCGFSSQESFSRAFRQTYGLSPGAYRRKRADDGDAG
jgi:AraC-like DNA-binding protein